MNIKCDLQEQRKNDTSITLHIQGDWNKDSINAVENKFASINKSLDVTSVLFDFKDAGKFDSAGMILIIRYLSLFIKKGITVTTVNMDTTQRTMLLFYRKNYSSVKPDILISSKNLFHNIGKAFISYLHNFLNFLNFLGQNFYYFFYTIRYPSKIRYKAIIKEIDQSGIKSIPIVVLTAFLIGLVIAYQAADQLQQFGANIFIVEMVTVSVLRELAPLITAIVIAGRSASSFTAQIGTMKITDEVDAMKTMGFEPSIFLVMPKVVALMISLPLIVFLADIVGIAGGMFVAKLQLGIGYTEFIDRIYSQIELRHFYAGLVKAPIFGFIIALIGCYRGFQVSGSTDSIGKYTTISVVNAIFWVIALDAIFSVVFTRLGV